MQLSTASKVTVILSRKLPAIGIVAAPVVKLRKSCSSVWRKFKTFFDFISNKFISNFCCTEKRGCIRFAVMHFCAIFDTV